MTAEEKPPTAAELLEAELLARALEGPDQPGRDLTPAEDALGAAYLLRASRTAGLDDLRARAVRDRVGDMMSGGAAIRVPREMVSGGAAIRLPRNWTRAAITAVLAIAAAAAAIALWPRGSAQLPAPEVKLLRAQLAAARPGASTALEPLSAEMNRYRAQVYASLGRAYGGRR